MAQRSGDKQPRAVVDQGRQVREQIPDLATRPAAELRRIDKDDVVALAASNLAGNELARIIQNPPDWCRGELGCGLALLRPCNGLARSIDVRDLGSLGGREQRRSARIGEQIEHARGSPAFGRPVPANLSRIQSQCGSCSGNSPRCRNDESWHVRVTSCRDSGQASGNAAIPPPLAGLLVVGRRKSSIGAQPGFFVAPRPPHGLRLGTIDDHLAKPLELAPIAAIEKAVVLEALRRQNLQALHRHR